MEPKTTLAQRTEKSFASAGGAATLTLAATAATAATVNLSNTRVSSHSNSASPLANASVGSCTPPQRTSPGERNGRSPRHEVEQKLLARSYRDECHACGPGALGCPG
eukprot:scaffold1009_cov375-Prasinococcus_capsulatus_cf.AAC.14